MDLSLFGEYIFKHTLITLNDPSYSLKSTITYFFLLIVIQKVRVDRIRNKSNWRLYIIQSDK